MYEFTLELEAVTESYWDKSLRNLEIWPPRIVHFSFKGGKLDLVFYIHVPDNGKMISNLT